MYVHGKVWSVYNRCQCLESQGGADSGRLGLEALAQNLKGALEQCPRPGTDHPLLA